MSLAKKFFKKSIKLGDYIAFVLPISQYNNTNSMYEFDLIHSEDLGIQRYSDRDLHCCFNIYKRPHDGELNKKKRTKLKDVSIIRQDSKSYKDAEYDIRMCYWGDGTAGKILKEHENYSGEYKIKIHNEELKDEILKVLHNYNWSECIKGVAMKRIKQWQIIDILKSQVSEIE